MSSVHTYTEFFGYFLYLTLARYRGGYNRATSIHVLSLKKASSQFKVLQIIGDGSFSKM